MLVKASLSWIISGRIRFKMKYDFDLSLEEHTSVGKIISQIPESSSVLEFGTGNGRMTIRSYLSTSWALPKTAF